MKNYTKSILLLLATLLFCATSAVSQTLLKPEIQFSNACNGAATDFNVIFKYSGSDFNSNNVFTIELSDADGNWGSPINVGTVTTENSSYTFSRTFQLPDNTYGTNYKIRLVASSPVMTSPDSDSFAAYKFSTDTLVLNNYDDVVLCDSGSAELILNTNQNGNYEWYKDDVLFTTTTEPKLEVTLSGKYEVKIDYGACGFRESTISNVIILDNTAKQIKGPSTVEICGDESHTFEANTNRSGLTYNWYLDNKLVQSSNSSTYTTPTTGQFGTYHLVIDTGTCTTKSNDVVLQQQTTAGFTVTNVGALERIILFGEKKELCITHDADSSEVTIEWYRDDVTMGTAVRNQLCIDAATAGVYYARVTKSTGSACDDIVDSEKFTLLNVTSFEPIIRVETSYEECNTRSTELSIVGVKAEAENGDMYDLTSDQIALLSFEWYKNNVSTGGTVSEYEVNSYLDNGTYTLKVSFNGVEGVSNELDVKLAEVPEIRSTSTSNSLCAGSSITYTINNVVAGYTYQWIKDGTDDVTPANPENLIVTEVGEYVLKYSGFGCDNELEPINVVMFDDSAVTITPSEIVVMEEGSSATITAAGGESYEWYQGESISGTTLSTTEQLEVTELGFYTVLVKVGACSVTRTVEVVEPDDQIIVPNTLTPNGDGKNDTWKISNKYAFQPLVTVMLYNANGKEILKTTEYKNDWPTEDLGNQKVFYYKIIREDKLIKAGTISVLH
ncbi:gliding motility-associated C-terminal domain-containing protein [Tenacibaculum larymnensis]|uniref:Gliding motility-associated C-terminal domain-containing protein n=1 Tax=Tenacibaculum larymnensis TaxID=2878201 RepID=A0A9X4EPE1_9FLAO|nr:gliding motility-associated C-terminal domain-containing protein [Tenacibaculum larymnensis]MDE1206898.1 gliding motility-associated C-terminal domain-containing protein [Tenacibaculum larymnensis]